MDALIGIAAVFAYGWLMWRLNMWLGGKYGKTNRYCPGCKMTTVWKYDEKRSAWSCGACDKTIYGSLSRGRGRPQKPDA